MTDSGGPARFRCGSAVRMISAGLVAADRRIRCPGRAFGQARPVGWHGGHALRGGLRARQNSLRGPDRWRESGSAERRAEFSGNSVHASRERRRSATTGISRCAAAWPDSWHGPVSRSVWPLPWRSGLTGRRRAVPRQGDGWRGRDAGRRSPLPKVSPKRLTRSGDLSTPGDDSRRFQCNPSLIHCVETPARAGPTAGRVRTFARSGERQ